MPPAEHGEETIDYPSRASRKLPWIPPWRVRVEVAALTDVGKVRDNNEDQYLVARSVNRMIVESTSLPDGQTPFTPEQEGYLMMVADGVGGHAGGEVASQLAVLTALELILNSPTRHVRFEGMTELTDRARSIFERVDQAIEWQAVLDPELTQMMTTLTVAYSVGSDLYIAHAGDSRAYLYFNHTLQQVTHDHVGYRLYESASGAGEPRRRKVLVNALGGAGHRVVTEVDHLRLNHGDRLLLCTDGLTDLVPDERIGAVLAGSTTSQSACRALVDLALDAGGHDNITAIVATYEVDPEGP